MDTITHTLFGLTLYGAVNKTGMTRKEKQALLFTTVAGSQIPDIDVISSWWDTAGRYQMWHRGLTHSVFLVPVWAAVLAVLGRWIWKTRGWFWLLIGALAVFIHDITLCIKTKLVKRKQTIKNSPRCYIYIVSRTVFYFVYISKRNIRINVELIIYYT
ncbi:MULTISPECIES: metal-dependent hydrolase [Paenibacillus]|uniref:metal-dependent hydrolase n=1 Tax=Paenibacillus TaxID=44249 RepID=UPI001E315C18|nr:MULTISPECIES: metal-dependent hydrolase [Paenibacillus]